MSLTTCLKRAGEFLHPDDKRAILASAREFRRSGMSAQNPAVRAVEMQHGTMRDMLAKHPDDVGRRKRRSRSVATTLNQMDKALTPEELEQLRARLSPDQAARLRPDGLLEPVMQPLHLCGGLEKPYLTVPESPDSASLPTSAEKDQPQTASPRT